MARAPNSRRIPREDTPSPVVGAPDLACALPPSPTRHSPEPPGRSNPPRRLRTTLRFEFCLVLRFGTGRGP